MPRAQRGSLGEEFLGKGNLEGGGVVLRDAQLRGLEGDDAGVGGDAEQSEDDEQESELHGGLRVGEQHSGMKAPD